MPVIYIHILVLLTLLIGLFEFIALDAHCLVEIYNDLQQRSEAIGVDWWQLMGKSSPNLNPKPSQGN